MAAGDIFAWQVKEDGTTQPVIINPIPMSKISVPVQSVINAVNSAGDSAGYYPRVSFEPAITSGTTLQYWSGNKTWQLFPSIPASQIQSDWTQASTGSLDYIKNKPVLSAVATTGAYADLSGKPTLGTAAAQSTTAFDASGAAAAAQAASQPLDSDLTAISALTTVSFGRGFLTLSDAASARTYIGAGTVTSVAASVPAGLSISGSPITTSGTFAITTALSGVIFGTGSGFGTLTVGSGLNLTGSTLTATGSGGTVTSISATQPASGFTITGSPITSSGTFTFTLANDLASFEALGSTNIIPVRTATDTWGSATISSPLTLTAGTLAISAATTGAAGSLSAADKTKLDALSLFGNRPALSMVTKTSNYTATVNDDVIFMDTTSVALTLMLPVASTYISAGKGKPLTVICIGAKTLTVQPVSGMIDNRVKDIITSTYTGFDYYPTTDGVNYVSL